MNTREFLRQHNLAPKQSLAQNFLVNEQYLAQIATAAQIASTDLVLEIGPGPGSLTDYLAQQAGRVIAIELDNRLIEPLRTRFADQPHVTIVHGDILELNPGELVRKTEDGRRKTGDGRQGTGDGRHATSYKVVANLPYYISSAVLRHLLEASTPPTSIVVLVQKEVGERICAEPGDLSLLAVSVQYYAKPTLVQQVPASAFYPRPKVDSAVLHLDLYPEPVVPNLPTNFFFRMVRAGFSQKRKQLANTLSAGLHLPKPEIRVALESANIDPRRRAETVSLEEWGVLGTILIQLVGQ